MATGATRRIVRAWFAALLVLVAPPAGAQVPDGPGPGEPTPRIVSQTAVNNFRLVAWLPDSRYLLTAFRFGHELILWDTRLGLVVDRIPLPGISSAHGLDAPLTDKITPAPDGSSVTVHAMKATSEPGAVKHWELRVDLRTRTAAITRVWVERTKVQRKPGMMAALGDLIGNVLTSMAGVLPMAEMVSSDPREEDRGWPLPNSPDGKAILRHAVNGLEVIRGSNEVLLPANRLLGYAGGALGPDGRSLALIANPIIEGDDDATRSVEIWDLQTASLIRSIAMSNSLEDIAWLDADHLAGMVGTSRDGRDAAGAGAEGPLDATIVVQVSTGRKRTVPARCYARALPGGGLVGAAPAQCSGSAPGGPALQTLAPDGTGWQPLPAALPPGALIDDLAVSPDGTTIAVAVRTPANLPAVLLIDRSTGRERTRLTGKRGDTLSLAAFAGDGRTLALAVNGKLTLWATAGSALVPLGEDFDPDIRALAAGDASTLVTTSLTEGNLFRFDLASGRRLPPLKFASPVAGGFVPGTPLYWAVSYLGDVRLWDTRSWTELLTTSHFTDGRFVAVTPRGTYDTNLGADTPGFRWLVSDRPNQSLAPQTFMRDYFEPGLVKRLLDCTFLFSDPQRDGCQGEFTEVQPIGQVNRVLTEPPRLTVAPGPAPGTARVDVTVRLGQDGERSSGLEDVRVLLDGRVVATLPGAPPPGPDGVWRGTADIVLPGAAGQPHRVSAYAFNDNRIKSDDGRVTYTPAAMPVRPRRALVLAIGVDSYAETRFDLKHANADAVLMAESLTGVPGFDPQTLTLTATRDRPLSKATIAAAFRLLAGTDEAAARDTLRAAGFDPGAFGPAGPDDLVFVTWAGHGMAWRGGFYLAASDFKWPALALPDTTTAISSTELSRWLTPVRAREITLVIDACNSANGVRPSFKPAPLGDSGLGQLAYDKGVRIMAATQGDKLARENDDLGHGLLSYVLAEGLKTPPAPGGKNGGAISLEQWLDHALTALPALSARPGMGSGGHAEVQVPVVYDYNRQASGIVLRSAAR